jgi:redox-sensitive bicupin YhaK (pirin superfamily)
MSSVIRKVLKVHASTATREGAGFPVNRPFPSRTLPTLDPFILLDEMGPVEYAPGKAKGAPDHPHRGFETVTYMLEGEFEHKDSRGNSGRLRPGDVQWMTAGRGVVHSELPPKEFVDKGGRFHGLQLWVNLPRKDKMIAPRYQELPSDKLPQVTSQDEKVWVKVIAGSALGQSAVIETRTPIMYLHVRSQPGSQFQQPASPDFNVFGYVLKGTGTFGPADRSSTADAHKLVQFEQGEGDILVRNESGSEVLEYLLIGGQPLKEPLVQRGPFVMNTQEEINQAWEDFHCGKMGSIDF